MKWMAALVVFGSVLGAQTESDQVLAVTAVRHWSVPDVTRVAVEISGRFQFHSDRLHNPERVYFDILNSRPRVPPKSWYLENLDDRLLKRIRVAETAPGISRVVLDLADGVEVTTSQLANPTRLMVELRGGPAVTPAPAPAIAAPAIPAPGVSAAARPTPPLPTPPPLTPAASTLAVPPPVLAPAKLESPRPVPPPMPSLPAPVSAPIPERAMSVPGAPAVAPPAAQSAETEVGKAARHTTGGETSLVRALGLKLQRVVIDPGHGGHDQGTQGPHGLIEKDLVLDIALRTGKLIEQQLGAEVIYTRSDDTFVPLEGRTALANDKKADLFLSIHANSSPVARIAGVETFYLNFPDSKDAADVSARENASAQKSIFELRDIIQTITLHDKAEESREFASRLQASLFAFSLRYISGQKNRGVKKAPFVVLIGANMPSVLAEIGFLSNPREEALLKKPDYRQKLAEALYRG
ncbi:MAG TPA: N-acetylmuramoyl-L-alanine amidase, partial [Candidatus Binataceae bacterium]|nr:N-acetylmuramoyl-L-alanine amidase [Candidatus Binataceae bacterium]